MTSQSPPEGWYPDPSGQLQQRWWTGHIWADRVRPYPGPVGEAPPGYAAAGYAAPGFATQGSAPWAAGSTGPHYAASAPANLPERVGLATRPECTTAMWAHLSPLLIGLVVILTVVGFWLALFSFVAPLIFMQTTGQRSQFVRAHSVEALNFTLFRLLIGFGVIAVSVLTLGVGLLVIALPILAWVVVTIVWTAKASAAAYRGELYRYPATIRFVH